MGGILSSLRDCHVVHVTDGSPRDPSFALRAGFSDRSDYAIARRMELERALSLVGISAERHRILSFVDREVIFDVEALAYALAVIMTDLEPEIVVTHAYEGGHPDHDAVACAVRAARRLLSREGHWPPAQVEMTGYHLESGAFVGQRFLPGDTAESLEVTLGEEERRIKRALFDLYISQKDVLSAFSIDVERFRDAPEHDFTRAPHEGALHYEVHGWFVGAEWRALAGRALARLERGAA